MKVSSPAQRLASQGPAPPPPPAESPRPPCRGVVRTALRPRQKNHAPATALRHPGPPFLCAGGCPHVPCSQTLSVSLWPPGAQRCVPRRKQSRGPFSTRMLTFWDLLAPVDPPPSGVAARPTSRVSSGERKGHVALSFSSKISNPASKGLRQ